MRAEQDDFEVAHVAAHAPPRDAPAEDAAVVVEVLDAPLARAAVVRAPREGPGAQVLGVMEDVVSVAAHGCDLDEEWVNEILTDSGLI